MTSPIGRAELDTLIQRIYDAALDPADWEGVAQGFREIFESPGGGMFMKDCHTQEFRPISMYGFSDRFLAAYTEYFWQTNAWWLAGLQRPGWTITDQSVDRSYDRPGAFAESEFCNDWLEPQGFRYGMGGAVKAFGSKYFHYTIMRPPDAPAYGQREIDGYDILKPHLARAVDLSTRLRNLGERLHGHSAVLERLPLGVLLLDHAGQVLHANRRAEALLRPEGPLHVRNGRLVAEVGEADGRLQQALTAAREFRDGGEPREGPYATTVSLPDGAQRVSVIAVPLSRAKPLFADPSLAFAVFLSGPDEPMPLDRDRLQAGYGLTRSEARLAVQLIRHKELKAAASCVGISHETARTYLKNVFRKTGTQGQAELIAKLLSDTALLVASAAEK